MTQEGAQPGHRTRVVWAAVVAVVVAVVLLLPVGSVPSSVVQATGSALRSVGAPDWLSDVELLERLLNIVLFVPVGAVLALLLRTWPVLAITLLGALASAGFEGVQAFLMPERDGSLWDVVTNTIGTALGAGLVALARGGVTWATSRR